MKFTLPNPPSAPANPAEVARFANEVSAYLQRELFKRSPDDVAVSFIRIEAKDGTVYSLSVDNSGNLTISAGSGPAEPISGGTTWRTGAGAPSDALGANGDMYLNTLNGDVYEKSAGHYSVVMNIKGTDGTNGTNGTNGTDGVGVPVGGTTGQLLKKVSATNYDTAWTDPVSPASAADVRARTDTVKYLTPASLEQKAAFVATKSADQTGIVTNTATKITFNTELFDTGSYFDSSNSKWTPPAGKIRISGYLRASGASTNAAVILSLYKNGSFFSYLGVYGIVGTIFSTAGTGGSIIDVANGTDYYELYGLVSSDSTATFMSDGCRFEGCQL